MEIPTDTPGALGASESRDAIRKRRSHRILVPLRIRVTGVDVAWDPFEEDTVTISVNKYGACISLEHVLLPPQRIKIKNLENDIETKFRVVGELRPVFGNRREWGVEALTPKCNIWGLDFAPLTEDVQPKILIRCTVCKNGVLSPISSIEYDVLLFTGLISRHCESCGETTRWLPCDYPLTAKVIPHTSRAVEHVNERRKHKRMKLIMLLRVRDSHSESELAQTLDVFKGGVCFLGKRQYRIGDVLHLTLPAINKPIPIETRCGVIQSQPRPRGTVCGVELEKEKTVAFALQGNRRKFSLPVGSSQINSHVGLSPLLLLSQRLDPLPQLDQKGLIRAGLIRAGHPLMLGIRLRARG